MGILRKRKRERFTTIDNTSIEDKRLKWDCKGLLLYLLSKPDGWIINRDHLATQTPDGREKVQRILRELEQFGYIRRYKEHNKENGTFVWISEISEYPNPSDNGTSNNLSSDGLSGDGRSGDGRSGDGRSGDGRSGDGLPGDGKNLHIVNTDLVNTDLVNTELTNTDLVAREFEKSDCKISDRTEDSTPTPLVQPDSTTASLVVSPISGKGESSGGEYIKQHQATQSFQDKWNYSSDIAPLTAELIRLYNNGKPDNWTGAVGDSGAVRRKIGEMVARYRSNGGTIEQLPEDWKNALLWYRGSDFHTAKDFGAGDIFWLCSGDKIENAAAKWAGSGEFAKRKVAKEIVEKENGIIDWRTGRKMGAFTLNGLGRIIPSYFRNNHPDKPPIEWVKKNAPEIFQQLAKEGLV